MKTSKPTKLMVAATIVIAVLVTLASLTGLLATWPYALETENWRQQAWGQDIGNLLAVIALVPAILAARKGSRSGFYIWIGTLLYLIYAFVIYAVSVHFGPLFLAYIAVLGLALFTVIFAISQLPLPKSGSVTSRRFAGGTLMFTGILFALLWLSEIISALVTGVIPKSLVEAGLVANPVYVLDLAALLPAFILTGYLCLKNKPLGLAYAAPWLWFSVLMGLSIIAAMAIILIAGSASVVAPMVMVGVVVILCATALVTYLKDAR